MKQQAHKFDDAFIRIKRTSTDGKVAFDMMVLLEGTAWGGYEPKPCLDPDHPAYSDPGSPAEAEIHGIVGVEDICLEDPEGEELELPESDPRAVFVAAINGVENLIGKGYAKRDEKYIRRGLDAMYEHLAEMCGIIHGNWKTLKLTNEECEEAERAVLRSL